MAKELATEENTTGVVVVDNKNDSATTTTTVVVANENGDESPKPMAETEDNNKTTLGPSYGSATDAASTDETLSKNNSTETLTDEDGQVFTVQVEEVSPTEHDNIEEKEPTETLDTKQVVTKEETDATKVEETDAEKVEEETKVEPEKPVMVSSPEKKPSKKVIKEEEEDDDDDDDRGREQTQKEKKLNRRATFQPTHVSERIDVPRTFSTTETSTTSSTGNTLFARVFGRRHSPPRNLFVPAPRQRTAEQGPVRSLTKITGAVRKTNPLLDEVLHAIKQVESNDPSLTVLDLNGCPVLSNHLLSALTAALVNNTNVKSLQLQNCNVSTLNAQELASVLRENHSIKILQLEGNSISPLGMRAIADMLMVNTGLTEVYLNRQKSNSGTEAEQQFAKSLSKNKTLLKLSLSIRDVASRHSIDRAISFNKDVARKSRLAAKKAASESSNTINVEE